MEKPHTPVILAGAVRCFNLGVVVRHLAPERDTLPMSQAPTTLDPWRLAWGQPYIDCRTLARAIEQDLARNREPDFRTRLLVHDAAVAIRSCRGARKFNKWLAASLVGPRVARSWLKIWEKQDSPRSGGDWWTLSA